MKALDRCRDRIFKELWRHYYAELPFASSIEKGLEARGDQWVEDHVAFRCLPGRHTGAHVLRGIFEAIGYLKQDDYHFEDKQLDAFWLAPSDTHGRSEEASPKVFVSELIASKFPKEVQELLARYTETVQHSPLDRVTQISEEMTALGEKADTASLEDELVSLVSGFLTQLPPWARPTLGDYRALQKHSEYASWTLIHGYRLNHFTVSVHHMKSFASITELGNFLESELNIRMNHSGGLVKGNPGLKLEQIATMAVRKPYLFQDAIAEVSYGFVEFAKRYPLVDGKASRWQDYYQGFVVANADRIFESTFQG